MGLEFLLNLFKYNDNSKNSFSDNYYRAALVTALGETVTPVVSMLAQEGPITSESLAEDTKKVLEEITRYLNMDKLLPCYRHTVTVACLKAIRKLQKTGHLPPNPDFFRDYARHGLFQDVRVAALECLVDYVRLEGRFDDLAYLIDMVEKDPDPGVRHKLARMMVNNPPFDKGRKHRNDKPNLVEILWKVINSRFWYDSRMRCNMVDLYYTLYGRKRPFCLPIPELAALGRSANQIGLGGPGLGLSQSSSSWSKKNQFVIPKAEKKEIKQEIKQEPGISGIPGIQGIQIKQEIDDRAHMMTGMDVPDFLMEGTPNANFMPPIAGGSNTSGVLQGFSGGMLGGNLLPPGMQLGGGDSGNNVGGDPWGHDNRKRKKEKKKKKKHKHRREEMIAHNHNTNSNHSNTSRLSSGDSTSGSNPASPLGPEIQF